MAYKLSCWGTTHDVLMKKAKYHENGNLAICMEETNGFPFARLTVNLGIELPEDMAFVDTNNCPWAVEFLSENKIATPTGQVASSGWCVYPLYQFDMSKIGGRYA